MISKLENNKINYLVIDRRNEYDVDMKEDYKKLNKYDLIYEKSNKYINCKNRIKNITEFLEENIEEKDFIKILGKMEEVIYERRKI